MSPTLARWKGRLAARRVLLKAAEARVAYWRTRKTKAKRGTVAYSHAGAMLARRERELATRRAQVAYAERVVARYSTATDVSARGLKFIGDFEGLRLTAYRDAVGVLTIGYGHTGPDVKPGQRITEAQAVALLHRDAQTAVRAVRALGLNLTQGQFDALVSIAFNVGTGVLGPGSTLGRKLRAHDLDGAADALLLYDHAGGQRLPGLTRRRRAERALFVA